LTTFELNNIIKSIDKYSNNEQKDLAKQILDYITKVEDGTARDVKDALGYPKEQIDLALSYLAKEGYIIKKGKNFQAINKVLWKDTFMDAGKLIDFEIPYFNEFNHFRYGDMIVIGGKTGTGKSILALNIIKRLVKQGIIPLKYVWETKELLTDEEYNERLGLSIQSTNILNQPNLVDYVPDQNNLF
jgi:hypothetical protein